MKMWHDRVPTTVGVHASKRTTTEVFLKGQVKETKCITTALDQQTGKMTHISQKAFANLLGSEAFFRPSVVWFFAVKTEANRFQDLH